MTTLRGILTLVVFIMAIVSALEIILAVTYPTGITIGCSILCTITTAWTAHVLYTTWEVI